MRGSRVAARLAAGRSTSSSLRARSTPSVLASSITPPSAYIGRSHGPLQVRQLSLGSIFPRKSPPAASKDDAHSSSSAVDSDPEGNLEHASIWSAELHELVTKVAFAGEEDVVRAETLFREMVNGSADGETVNLEKRKEGARLIVDHWEKLGGWVRLFFHPIPLAFAALAVWEQHLREVVVVFFGLELT